MMGRHDAVTMAAEVRLGQQTRLQVLHDGVPMQPPTSVPRLVELLEVPVPMLRAHLEQVRKEAHEKGREVWCPLSLLQQTPS